MMQSRREDAFAEADFVIAGGGTAGCVLAARLSENPDCNVILIEAGGRDSSPYIHLPVTYYKTTGPKFTWGYQTAPIEHQGGISTPYAQARVLGGGSSINAQVYMRGMPQDYDEWRDEYGCSNWGYEDVLPYFIKSENNQRLAGALHGTDGPLNVSDQAHTDPLTYAWLLACQQTGMPYNTDFNSGARAGCGLYQVNNRNGRRASAATCYLRPAGQRQNLKIMTDMQVARIVIEDGKAVGVMVLAGNESRFIAATREVVVTAGAIGTPNILLHSGIGPGEQLAALDIPVAKDLSAVGQNLQDHLDIFMIYRLNGRYGYDKYKRLIWKIWAGLQFLLYGSGPITSNVVEGGAFWWVDRNNPFPDVQFHFLAGAGVEAGIADVPGGSGCTLNAYLVRPKSRGSVSLASNDPREHPVIDPKYLSDEEDLCKTVESVKLGRRIMQQPALSSYIRDEHFPGEVAQSQEDLEEFVRKQARTGYHPGGTCRMGGGGDGVVDTQLRVRGIEGLRLADNSIMPRLVSGNTNATAIMIAERAADFIRGNYTRS